jgi:hypothetical protein
VTGCQQLRRLGCLRIAPMAKSLVLVIRQKGRMQSRSMRTGAVVKV